MFPRRLRPLCGRVLKTRVFSKRPGLFKNPNLVDLGDVLLRFEGFKNMLDQWVLEVYE